MNDKTMRFPIGGPRMPVYSFLREYGFTVSEWCDKEWYRVDGVQLNLYGAGSKARITDRSGNLLCDGDLEAAVLEISDCFEGPISEI